MSVEIIKTISDIQEYREWYYLSIGCHVNFINKPNDIGSIYAVVESIPIILMYLGEYPTTVYLSAFYPSVASDNIIRIKDNLISHLSVFSTYVLFTDGFIEGKYSKEEYIQKVMPLVIK